MWILQIWSVNYALHFGGAKIHKNCLYWSVFSTDVYRKIAFNRLLLFKLFMLVSKLYESVNSKFSFLTCLETEARFIFEGFSIIIYGKFNSNFQVLFYFLFFHAVCILFKSVFNHFLSVSKLHQFSLWFQWCSET